MGEGDGLEIPLSTPESFPFPYPTPYSIQVDLMRTVFEAIERKKIAIVSAQRGRLKVCVQLIEEIGRVAYWDGKEFDPPHFYSDLVKTESEEGG
jgi:hypothetical protein